MVLKTSDLAICAEVSQATIRDYCDQGLLGPVPRSKSSSFRSFDPRMAPQVHLIRALRDMGFTAQQIKEYGQNRTPETTIRMFRKCGARLSEEIAALQARLDMLQSHVSLMEEGQAARPGIELRALPEQRVRRSSFEGFGGKRKDQERIYHAHGLIRYSGNPGCPLGFAYDEFLDLLEDPEHPAQLVSYDPQGPDVRPAGEYLVGTVNCYYGEKSGLARRMFEYALHNHLEFHGPAHTVYLLDTASVTEAENYLMQIAAGVKRKAQGE